MEAESQRRGHPENTARLTPALQLGLFALENPAVAALLNLDVEDITPKQALNLHELKRQAPLPGT